MKKNVKIADGFRKVVTYNVKVLDEVGHFTDEFSILGLLARLPFKHLLSEDLNQKFKLKIKKICY